MAKLTLTVFLLVLAVWAGAQSLQASKVVNAHTALSAEHNTRTDINHSEHQSVRERFTTWLANQGVPAWLIVFLGAMLPIIELRGAIPVGISLLGLSAWQTFGLAVLGNILPIFIIMPMLNRVFGLLKRWPFANNLLQKLFARTRRKGKSIERYQELGLIMFVAIPLPVTGAWTGALAAWMFGLGYFKSMVSILIGVLAAGTVVTALTLLGWTGAIIALAALALLAGVELTRTLRRRRYEVA